MPIPEFMCRGSQGPHVVLLQAFLKGYFRGREALDLSASCDYGDVTANAVSDYQMHCEIDVDVDGHCGPPMRKNMQKDEGFDFEAAAMLIPGTTIFVQRNGERIEWSPEMEKPLIEFHEGVAVRDTRFPGPFFDDGVDRGNEGIEAHDATPDTLKRYASTHGQPPESFDIFCGDDKLRRHARLAPATKK